MNTIYNFMLENFSLLMSLLILAIIMSVMFVSTMGLGGYIKNLSSKLYQKVFKKKKIKEYHIFDDYTINMINKINERLAVMRAELNADRAYIVEFHNGQVFISKNPRWKMSQTYEKVKAGVSYEGPNLQNLEVTLYWEDFIKIFFIKDLTKLPPGISVLEYNPFCEGGCAFPRGVYFIDVTKMDHNMGPVRSLFESQHVYYMLVSPILNYENMPIGFIGIDFCQKQDIQIIEDEDFKPCKICQLASLTAYDWEKDIKLKKKLQEHQREIWDKKTT